MVLKKFQNIENNYTPDTCQQYDANICSKNVFTLEMALVYANKWYIHVDVYEMRKDLWLAYVWAWFQLTW